MPTTSPYGSWKSPLSSKIACDSSISIKNFYVDAKTPNWLYWSELRPAEAGRRSVFRFDVTEAKLAPERWTPDDGFNVANKVHEYGGAAFIVHDGVLYFSNFYDGKIYKQEEKQPPRAVTKTENTRYADADFYKPGHHLFCVREDHRNAANHDEPVNTIVVVDVDTGGERVVVSGCDFYSTPRVSWDGKKLAWVQWNHPNMPWDNTEIWVGDVMKRGNDITVENAKRFGGQEGVNFMEPRWRPNGDLLFICDKTGWWNLHSVCNFDTCEMANLCNTDQEIGGPCWQFGAKSFSPHPVHSNLIAITYNGVPAILDTETGSLEKIDIDQYKAFKCTFHPTTGNCLYMICKNPCKPEAILCYNIASKQLRVLHQLQMPSVLQEDGFLSIPRHVTFPTDNGSAEAYGYYYPPANKNFVAPRGSLPPLIIKIHGGPTSCASLALDLRKQYFTSRGIAILDVDYRGSTGYGTKYRRALYGNWGVVDIEDACAGAQHMAKGDGEDRVDAQKLLIDGGSAGGYTTLACLTFRKVFKAGASYYGVSDLEALAKETHKFESRYLDQVLGKDPAVYKERSPINHLDKFKTPCAFFQGSLDKIVPQNQAEMMLREINKKKVPCAYVLFPNEGHGFKRSENKQKSLDGELYFYSRILGFKAADKDIEIDIWNLPEEEKLEENESKRQRVDLNLL